MTVPLGSIKFETSRPPNPTPPPQPLLELTCSGFLEATKTNEQRLRLLAEVKDKNEKLHTLLHTHFLFNELAEQAAALHGKNNDLCSKMTQITALLTEAEKDQLALHKQSTAHLRDCERRAKEYMELLSPTVLVTLLQRPAPRLDSRNSPAITPSGIIRTLTCSMASCALRTFLANSTATTSVTTATSMDTYAMTAQPIHKCPVCQTNCGKKPKTCPKIIPPLITQTHIVDIPPPYFAPPSQHQDGRQTPFHSETLNNPIPIADRVRGRVPLRNCSHGRGMPSRPYQRIAPRPLAPIVNDMRQSRHTDVPRIHINHRRQPFRADIPYPHHHRELVPVLDPYEIPTNRTPNQVVDYIDFPTANMSVTYNPRPTAIGFCSCDAFIDARIDAGDYGELFEW